MPLPPEMVVLLAAFAPLFSDRVWAHAQILAIGAILATGKRTVTSALRIMGLSHDEHFTNSHRVLNRAAWCPRAASRILLGLIVRTLVPADWPIVLVADDTVERRHGRKIKAKGCYRDAVRSSRKVVVKCFGLKWVAMMVLVQLPWNKHVKALPFLTVLGWPESAPRRRAHKTSIDCVKQMVLQVRRWFPQRRVVLVLDGGFAAVKLARACRRHGVTMICRLRLDAGLYDPPGEQPTSKRGPKPKKGPRQVKLQEWTRREDTPWEDREVEWYGGERKQMRLFSRTGLWYTAGQDPVAIRYLLARDPEGALEDAGYLCTEEEMLPEEIMRVCGLALERRGDVRGDACSLGDGDATAMVRPGDRADDAGVAGSVFAGGTGGGAVSRGGFVVGGGDGVVRQGGANVLRLPAPDPQPDLAGTNSHRVPRK